MHSDGMDTDLGVDLPILYYVRMHVYSTDNNNMITYDATIDITFDDTVDVDVNVDAVHVYVH